MSDVRSHVLERILGRPEGGDAKDVRSHSKEWQATSQALDLHVESRDGKTVEGFPWQLHAGYKWQDIGNQERLRILFGNRAVEIEGHNLLVLVDEIREGQLNGIRELTKPEAQLLGDDNPKEEPIITGIRCYPDFDAMFGEITGEQDNHETRHARRA
jgi:hypothetical protein